MRLAYSPGARRLQLGRAGWRDRLPVNGHKALAWAVHCYTASGALLAAAALFAASTGDFRRAWLLLYATIWIDATDGLLARAARVHEWLPGFDGRRLDDIVDYLTWVFVPVVLLVQAALIPGWLAAAPLIASGYGFARVDAKTDDNYFLGFPSYWSLVGFFMYEFQMPQWVGAPLVAFLSLLVFTQIRFPYPTKTRILRTVTLVLGAIWGVCILALMVLLPERPRAFALATLFYPVYYLVLTVYLAWRRSTDRLPHPLPHNPT